MIDLVDEINSSITGIPNACTHLSESRSRHRRSITVAFDTFGVSGDESHPAVAMPWYPRRQTTSKRDTRRQRQRRRRQRLWVVWVSLSDEFSHRSPHARRHDVRLRCRFEVHPACRDGGLELAHELKLRTAREGQPGDEFACQSLESGRHGHESSRAVRRKSGATPRACRSTRKYSRAARTNPRDNGMWPVPHARDKKAGSRSSSLLSPCSN